MWSDMMKEGDYLLTDFGGWNLHGIYVGSEQVLSFTYNGWTFNPFQLISLEEFVYKDIKVRKYLRPKYSGKTVVERAYSRLGETVELDLGETCNWAVTGMKSICHGMFVDRLLLSGLNV
jgi:hypothetical protein